MEQLFLKDESHLTAQSNDVRDTVTRIQELQQRSQQLSATLDLYAQLMNQLESDYTHQKQMVAYVENQVNRWTMYRRLSRPFKGDGFVGIIAIVAVGMGVGSVLFKWRRL
jgi:archaellum component FlaC